MWYRDEHGTKLDGSDEAREELRRRAKLAISAGVKQGLDVRHLRVRLSDETGKVIFDGSIGEAAASDHEAGPSPVPAEKPRGFLKYGQPGVRLRKAPEA